MKNKEAPLDIIGFDDREQKHPKGIILPEWMPKHEFFMLVIAPAGCGKTTLILNLLLRIYKYYFNKVIVFSPTIHNDQKWQHLVEAKGVIRPNANAALFKDVVEDSSQTNAKQNAEEEYTEEEREWLKVQMDTFEIDDASPSTAKKGSKKKRMGKEQLQMWQLLRGRKMQTPEDILKRKRRIDRLTALIRRPTDPVLAKKVHGLHTNWGIPTPLNPSTECPVSSSHKWHHACRLRVEPTEHTQNTEQPQNHQEDGAAEDVVAEDVHVRGHSKGKKRDKTQVDVHDLYEEYTEETVQKIMDQQDKVVSHLTKKDKPMTMADHMCWVFDDMVGSGLFNQKRNNAFKRLSVRRRHFCSSVVGVVQAYKEFPKTSRNNTNIFILFRIDSEEELVAIYRDFPCGLKPDTWRTAYEYCTKEPYGFMMINLQVKDPMYRITKNFTEPLLIPLDKNVQASWAASLGGPKNSIADPSVVAVDKTVYGDV